MSDSSSSPDSVSGADSVSESGHSQRDDSDGNYVVVARRYRPRGFDELVGQDHVGRALKNAIETSRVGHAYLFTGARGVGKTSTARIFAKALNDPSGPTATPDNESDVAQAIDSGEDVDVIEIDGASNRGIDEIRSLRANVGVRPSRSKFKIYIIDEVHMLTGAAFNALLKTLEEPPEHVKFIFCTTDPEKIPITVLSRCQRFDFAPVEVGKIIDRLREIVTAEKVQADDEALELIARRASGSMRDSQSLLEQVLSFSDGTLTAEQVHTMLGTADDERLHALAGAMADRDAAEAMRQLDAGIDAGVDAGRLAEQLLGYFRDLMAVTVGCDRSMLRHTSVALHDELKELGQKWGLQTVLAVVGLIDQTLVRIRHSVHSRVLLEAALIQICHLPDLQNIADLAAAAGSLPQSATKSPNKPAVEKKNVVPAPHLDHPSAAGVPAPVNQAPVTQAPVTQGPVTEAPLLPASSAQAVDHQSLRSAADSLPSQVAVIDPSPSTADASLNTSPIGLAVTATAVADDRAPSAQQSVTTPSATASLVWNQQTAERVWSQAIGDLEAMTETLARAVDQVVASGDQKLRLVFPSESKLAMSRCELPEHKTALTDSVCKAAGQPIHLELALEPPKVVPKKFEPAVNKPSRMQRMREIEAHPLVKSCVELFEAEIVRVDKPR